MTFSRRPIHQVLLLLVLSISARLAAQPPEQGPAVAAPSATPSAVLRQALDSVRQALAILRPDRWKAPAQVDSESASDIGSIQRDLDNTLPQLLSAADAAPGSTAQLLPAYRNVDALYDVLVRVTQTAVLSAPPQQSVALQQATASLQQGRRDLGDMVDAAAQSQDRQFHQVQVQLRTLQNTPPPPAPVCPPPPTPAKKPKPRARPKPKPAPAAATVPPATQ